MKKCSKSVPSKTEPIFLKEFYSVSDVAVILNKGKNTVIRKCESGEIKAIPQKYGDNGRITYLVPKTSLEVYVNSLREKTKLVESKKLVYGKQKHNNLLDEFVACCISGSLNGRPFSPETTSIYRFYLEQFFKTEEYLTSHTYKAFMKGSIPIPKRELIHRSLMCYGKFLVKKGLLNPEELEIMAQDRPKGKRENEIKRTVLSEEQVKALFELAKKQPPLNYAIFCLLIGTGLRNRELCDMELAQLDLDRKIVLIRRKGGKFQKLGFPEYVKEALISWLAIRPQYALKASETDQKYLFLTAEGKQLLRYGVRARIEALGKKLGFDAHPHALRRAFVTINACKGRSLATLSESVGHSNWKTTQKYCRIAETTVIESMQAWDLFH